jgi:hypothetical protein
MELSAGRWYLELAYYGNWMERPQGGGAGDGVALWSRAAACRRWRYEPKFGASRGLLWRRGTNAVAEPPQN